MDSKSRSVLHLLPLPISAHGYNSSIPAGVLNQITVIQSFIAENAKTARHFLKAVKPDINWENIRILELDKHNPQSQAKEIRAFLQSDNEIGLMSEAGMPCIADPGNYVVRLAHDSGIRVRPMVGPSSILLALIASGMNGQQFTFNGYLPSKPAERQKALQELERSSGKYTQLFIEAPYRNDAVLSDMVKVLKPDTRILIAKDLDGPDEEIICKTVAQWRKIGGFSIGKIPCMFGIGQ